MSPHFLAILDSLLQVVSSCFWIAHTLSNQSNNITLHIDLLCITKFSVSDFIMHIKASFSCLISI